MARSLIGEIVDELPDFRLSCGKDHDDTPAGKARRKALIGKSTEIRPGDAPDVLELFGPAHGAHRTRFPLDDRSSHTIDRAGIGQIAIGMEPAEPAVDLQSEENAGDALRLKLAHREVIAAHEERRQDLEHAVMVGFGDFEPFTGVEPSGKTRLVEGRLVVAVHHRVEFVAAGDTFEDLARFWTAGHGFLLRFWPEEPCLRTF
ncbi:hypothetical protein AJ87_08965 [Rhizobium yanglingense]|nr:hypothetical protein AJ87_08965 [Rhizobium yanglingense]